MWNRHSALIEHRSPHPWVSLSAGRSKDLIQSPRTDGWKNCRLVERGQKEAQHRWMKGLSQCPYYRMGNLECWSEHGTYWMANFKRTSSGAVMAPSTEHNTRTEPLAVNLTALPIKFILEFKCFEFLYHEEGLTLTELQNKVRVG